MKPFRENYQFKTFSVRGMELPSVMLGTSPFIGAGQFGAKAMLYHTQFFLQPQNITEMVAHCVGLGVNAVQAVGYPRIMAAIREAMEESDTEVFILGTVGLGSIEREIESMLEAGAKGVVLHGSLADREIDFVREYLAPLRGKGIVTGIATHRPGLTIPNVEDLEEVEVILCPFNKLGRFMEPSFQSTLKAIENSSKKIIAIKPLAAGRLSAEEGLSYLSHKVDGVAVGIASKKEAEETFRIARRLLPPEVS